jgi:hypothetical protein
METGDNKKHAHALIERLDDSEIAAAVRFLEFLTLDPVSRSLATAPVEDLPLTGEEEQALRSSREWFKQNRGIPHDEILAEFGLTPPASPHQ